MTMVWRPIEFLEQADDLPAGLRIEVAGRFVGQDHIRLVRQSACNRHALPLSAGQLQRSVFQSLGQADRRQEFLSPRPSLAPRKSRQREGDFDVLAGGQHLQQVECLEDEAQSPKSERRSLFASEILSDPVLDTHLSGSRRVDQTQQLQQRRFTRPGRSGNGDEVPLVDVQGEWTQGVDRLLAEPVDALQVPDRDQWRPVIAHICVCRSLGRSVAHLKVLIRSAGR